MIIKILLLLGISTIVFLFTHEVSANQQLQNYVSIRAEEYDLDPQKIHSLIWCESGYTHFLPGGGVIVGDHGKSFGILQFQKATVKKYSYLFEEVFDRLPELKNPFDQIDLAMLMLRDNSENWHHWQRCSIRNHTFDYMEKNLFAEE